VDFRTSSIASLAAQVRARTLGARELVAHALDRIEALDGDVNAFCAVEGERALAEAAALDDRLARAGGDGHGGGALAGIPFGVKDLEDVEGFVTTYGSPLRAAAAPATADSVLVARLRAAGAIVVGKTNTPEYGHKGVTDNPLFGPTANPWSLRHSAGGSSGGTAAAIAAGMVPLGTGSDGGGSIRIPAAVCGFAGIKTSNGRVPVGGPTAPGSGQLSVKGTMARTVRDNALALDAVVGPDPADIFAHPAPTRSWAGAIAPPGDVAPPARVAWSPTLGYGTVTKEILAACEAAVARLAAAGTEVVEVPTVFARDPLEAWWPLWAVARYRTQGELLGTPEIEKITPSIRSQVEAGANISTLDFARALDACWELNWRLDGVLGPNGGILLCPTPAGFVPELGKDEGMVEGVASVGWVQFTYPFNLTRNPAGTVCVGIAHNGLPIGLQVVGRQLDDVGVLRTMAALEDAVGADFVAPLGTA
jgi:Asp-tRNA(Asn)/Glu-tRNA(Gln) amidotransferase A subunit family amidase